MRLGTDWQVERGMVQVRGFREELGGDVTLPMLQIPAARFLMGSLPEEEGRSPDEGPQHEVELESFFMGQTPITQAQWRAVAEWKERPGEEWSRRLNPNPSKFADQVDSSRRPVERVSWAEAMEFCSRLSQRTGRTYTLPSEAQWEYACRAGSTTPFHFGDTITSDLANYRASSPYADGPKGKVRRQTTPAGRFPANAWGLQDMHGNVWEWCLDYWHGSYQGAPADGHAWLNKDPADQSAPRLLRGGSWARNPRNCRSAFRDWLHPDDRGGNWGFRVCCLPQDLIIYP
jgi:formylglycine-generating enzyme required for sulfatase activity